MRVKRLNRSLKLLPRIKGKIVLNVMNFDVQMLVFRLEQAIIVAEGKNGMNRLEEKEKR